MKNKTLLVSSAVALLTASPLLADVREGLVAYWPMNTATGGTPMTTPDVVAGNDMTGPGKDSSTALVPGHFGNAVTFSGDFSDYLYLTPAVDSGLPVAKLGSWSYSVWVNGPSNQVSQSTYFAETTSQSASYQWRFSMESDGTTKTRTWIRDGGGGVKISAVLGNTNTLDDTWHHLAYTYDISTSKFICYVDGQAVSTNIFTYAQNAASFDQISIGALVRATVAVPFIGAVDDVALWGRALSQAEVRDVMNNSIATPVPAFAPVITLNPKGATGLVAGDNITLNTACYGTRPLYYQWLKNGTNYPGANANSLTLSSVTTDDSGAYQLVVSNSVNSATSTVAQITVNAFAAPNLTNGIIAYWPCDSIVAGYTPDPVAAYDMPLFGGMSATNIVAGKWGNALSFDKTIPQYGKKVFAPTDTMPGVRRTNFTYSVWVNNTAPGASWQFAEASSAESGTFHGFGNNGGANTRMYIRTSTSTVISDTSVGTPNIWDGAWHNVIYSQHDIGGGTIAAQVYLDGVLAFTPASSGLLQPDSLGFCINPRSTLGSPSGGSLDEVVYWNRVLSPAEIAQLQTSYITNPPSALPPLAINSFKADLAAVVSGDSTVLRWSVPANITTATISGIGDVKAMTVAGGGTTNKPVTVTNKTTYTLTITRGVESVSKSVTIGAVTGVAAGWSLLDNFDFYNPGVLTTNGTWNAVCVPDTMMVVQPTGLNRLAGCYAVDGNASGGILNLQGLAVTAGQARTLFFRMTPKGNPIADILHEIGITERVGTIWAYLTQNNSGPMAYPKWDFASSAWWMGVSTGGAYNYDTSGLTTDAVYKVWIDVTNVPIVNVPGSRVIPDEEDLFSVYIQKEGDPGRTALFENIPSDRALNTVDDFTGTHYPDDNINKLYVLGNSFSGEVLFDDIYLSKTGILATTPIGPGFAGGPPSLQIVKSGGSVQVLFQGTLQAAPAVTGTYTNVPGATSPYPVTTSGDKKFYRAVY